MQYCYEELDWNLKLFCPVVFIVPCWERHTGSKFIKSITSTICYISSKVALYSPESKYLCHLATIKSVGFSLQPYPFKSYNKYRCLTFNHPILSRIIRKHIIPSSDLSIPLSSSFKSNCYNWYLIKMLGWAQLLKNNRHLNPPPFLHQISLMAQNSQPVYCSPDRLFLMVEALG